jgi:RHS repeat-associated protein
LKDYTTTFTFDDANQLVSSTTDGVTTFYSYDAAGRLVTEGNKTYRYGYLDKVMLVSEGDKTYTYMYHPDGQLASANYGGKSEEFFWDGLALIQRGDDQFMNEPHIGGGNPVASSNGTSYFNDVLGTTVGAKKDGKYSPAALSAFGERLDNIDSTSPAIRSLGEGWFTGKPYVEGLGHAFLMRNYRAGLAKWQTADSIGYPDGWNQLAYGPNSPLSGVDFLGASWGDVEMVAYYFRYTPISLMSPPLRSIWDLIRPLVVDDSLDTDTMGLTDAIFSIMDAKAHEIIDKYVATEIAGAFSGDVSKRAYSQSFGVDCGSIVWALGGGSGNLLGELSFSWSTKYETDNRGCRYMIKSYSWEFVGEMKYSDSFKDPIDVINYIDRPDLEAPTGAPYDYGHIWRNYRAVGQGEKRFLEE